VLHEQNILLTVETTDSPRTPANQRVEIADVDDNFKRVTIRYGFMETPNLPKALGACRKRGLKFDKASTSFFLSRRSLVASRRFGLPIWQDRIFIFLMRNAGSPTDFFHLPAGRVVEMGAQVKV
jgi:KUP system potassium uptake protein